MVPQKLTCVSVRMHIHSHCLFIPYSSKASPSNGTAIKTVHRSRRNKSPLVFKHVKYRIFFKHIVFSFLKYYTKEKQIKIMKCSRIRYHSSHHLFNTFHSYKNITIFTRIARSNNIPCIHGIYCVFYAYSAVKPCNNFKK